MYKGFIFSILLFLGTKTFACSCLAYDLDEAYSYNDVVIIGTVEKFGKQSWWARLFAGSYPKLQGSIDISKIYKGTEAETVVVYTNNGSAACGFPFEEGVEYAVFAKVAESGDYKGKLLVSSCNPTIHTQLREDYYEPERRRVMEFLSSK